MSAHYSKFLLNTYAGTPYFEAQLPPDYPLLGVLQKSRMFRRLPPHLKQLTVLAKQWAVLHGWSAGDIDRWYDSAGNELNPSTGRKLTDAEINDEWDRFHPDPSLAFFTVTDIPIPLGGFADPHTWEEPAESPVPLVQESVVGLRWASTTDDDAISPKQILQDIVSHGKAAVMATYGVEEVPSFEDGEDSSAAEARFAKRAAAVLGSPYVAGLPADKQAFITEALTPLTDTIYEDLGGEAQDIFDRAEASLQLQAMASI